MIVIKFLLFMILLFKSHKLENFNALISNQIEENNDSE